MFFVFIFLATMSVVNLESMAGVMLEQLRRDQEAREREREDEINRVGCFHWHKRFFEFCIGEVQSGRGGVDALGKCLQLLKSYPFDVDQDFADRRSGVCFMSFPGHAKNRIKIAEALKKNYQEIASYNGDVISICVSCVEPIEKLRCKLLCMLIDRGYRPAYEYAQLLINGKKGFFASSLNKAIVGQLKGSLHNKQADGSGEDVEMFEQAKKNDASVPAES